MPAVSTAIDSYTAGEIAKAIDAPRRSVIFWADRGVLRPIDANAELGRGVFRKFGSSELAVAAMAKKLFAINCSIGEVIEICEQFRQIETPRDVARFAAEKFKALAEAAGQVPLRLTRFEAADVSFAIMSAAVLAGAFPDRNVSLIISYGVRDGTQYMRTFYIPEHPSWDIMGMARTCIAEYRGCKVVPMHGEGSVDLIVQQDDPDQLAALHKIIQLAMEHLQRMLDFQTKATAEAAE